MVQSIMLRLTKFLGILWFHWVDPREFPFSPLWVAVALYELICNKIRIISFVLEKEKKGKKMKVVKESYILTLVDLGILT